VTIHFARPMALMLLLCLVPMLFWARRSMGGLSRPRWVAALVLRLLITVLVVLALAQMQWLFVRDEMTVIYAVDQSLSIPPDVQKKDLEFVRQSSKQRRAADSAGLVLFGRSAALERRPDTKPLLESVGPQPPGRSGVAAEAVSLQSVTDPQRTSISAALRLALATFPSSSLKRIVLVSDGNENLGSAKEELEAARRNHVRVDVLPVRYEYGSETMVEKVLTPGEVDKGGAFEVRTVVSSTVPQDATLRVEENGRLIASEKVKLKEGRNVFVVPRTLPEPGYFSYTATVEAAHDTLYANNKANGFTMVRGAGRILLVEGDPERSTALPRALAAQGLEVKTVGLSALPLSLGEIVPYDAIILSNVQASSLGEDGMRAVELAVKDWGVGLVMIGGEQSFGPGGYQDSPIERALPVSMDVKQRQVMPSGALVIVLHTCEIAEGNYWAQQVALAALRVLSASDEFGVLYYDWQKAETWLFPLQRAGNKEQMASLITSVQPGDMPSFITILGKAHQALKASHASVKHIVLTSDGDPAYPGDDVIAQMVADGITISTVGISPHSLADTDRLGRLAQMGKGRYYDVQNASALPQIFIKEAATVRRSMISEEPFTPAAALASEIVRGISGYPTLRGYVLTTPKELAEVPLVGPEKDPLLAHWQYGLGRAVAFTSDAKGRWAADWVSWSKFEQFWAQVLRWSARSVQGAGVRANVDVADDRGHVVIDAIDTEGRFINSLKFDGVLVTPDKKEVGLAVSQTGPGRYEATFDAQETGTHYLSLRYTDEHGKTALYTRGVVVPYSAEYRELRANESLLKEIAAVTGGRMLNDIGDNIFARTFAPDPNPRDAWPLLLFLAAVLLPLDVFVRRVFLDWRAIRARAEAAVEWVSGRRRKVVEPSHVTVLLSKKATTREEMDRRARKFDTAGPISVEEPALGPKASEPEAEVRTMERPAAPSQGPSVVHGDQTYTGRLLSAKRKLREESKRENEGPGPEERRKE
jgi:uncharacterized membrane protein